MAVANIHAVTGAYGFSGKYIAQRLLDEGRSVITLTNSASRINPFGDTIRALPFHFDRPDLLAEQLAGVSVLYNTYWVRFNHRLFKQSDAVRNTLVLFEAAKNAGVERIVHVSITNPAEDSPLEYFRSKAILERALIESGMSYAILRPAILFGEGDVLINNIAWALRRMPIFGVFGNGRYRLQPIYVDDLAGLAVEQGKSRDNVIINAIGPETFTYRQLVGMISQAIAKRRLIISVPPSIAYAMSRLMGRILGDVIITREELSGLMGDMLYVDAPPAGQTALSDWVRKHAETLGRRYSNELARRIDRVSAYPSA